ncbi:MAG: hypothetical protein E7357_06315 [Clostridiales bacterium]|nr:hypothetical protein [Clostridiales bacterium]
MQPISVILPNGNEVPADQYTVTQRKYIENYEYFTHLKEGCYGANDEEGENACGSVAAQILLSYNNWANDGRLITGSAFLMEGREDVREQPYHEKRLGTTSNESQSNSFYNMMKHYINPIEFGDTTVGAILPTVKVGIERYLRDCTEIASTVTMNYSLTHVMNATRAEINQNRPVLASLAYYDGDSTLHIVVAYGYQTFLINGEEVDGLVAHFGWDSETSNNLWANQAWVNSVLSFQTSHVHTDESLANDAHIIECLTCNRTKTTENHTYSSYQQLNKTDLQYQIYHTAFCDCGYSEKRSHLIRYQKTNALTHKIDCPLCAMPMGEAEHLYKYGDTCFYCDYTLGDY